MKKDEIDYFRIILYLILFLLFGIIIITCKPAPQEYIMSVSGPVPVQEMGMTLTHEHILVDFIGADSTGYFRWNRNDVVSKALPHLMALKEAGLQTFIECTPAYLGRDPYVLKELAQKTGISFITNTGYYGAVNNKYLPAGFYDTDAPGLAEIWINEWENGIEESGVKPGFIKIAVGTSDTLSPEHRKIITAAGLAHLSTGLVIASHTGPEKPAIEQISILREMGVDPSAFIWVHAQSGSMEALVKAAEEGAWISLDNVRARPSLEPGEPNSIEWYADKIIELNRNGLISKVLISHDSGWYDPSQPDGGNFNGFMDIFTALIPRLKEKGLKDSDIDQIMIRNPAEAFKIKVRTL